MTDPTPFDYSPFLIQDLANLARTTKSIRMSRACMAAMEELIHHRRNGTTRDNPVIRFLEDRVRYLEDKLLSTPPTPSPAPTTGVPHSSSTQSDCKGTES